MRLRFIHAALAVVLATTEGAAFGADETDREDVRKAATDDTPGGKQWYGGQTLAVDLSTIALLVPVAVLGTKANAPALPLLNLAVFELGAPIVHAMHGHPLRALGSAVMRAVLVGGPVYKVLNPDACRGMFCNLGETVDWALAGLVGTGVSIAVDAVLAYDDPLRDGPVASRPALHLDPEVLVVARGAGLGLGGAF